MSLEQAIKDNTAAVTALMGVWSKLVEQGNAVTANVTAKVAAGESTVVTAAGKPLVKVEAPKPKAAAAPAPTPAAESPVEAPITVEPETATASPFDEGTADDQPTIVELTKATTLAATRNREGLVSLLKEYGAARASAIPASEWAEYIARTKGL